MLKPDSGFALFKSRWNLALYFKKYWLLKKAVMELFNNYCLGWMCIICWRREFVFRKMYLFIIKKFTRCSRLQTRSFCGNSLLLTVARGIIAGGHVQHRATAVPHHKTRFKQGVYFIQILFILFRPNQKKKNKNWGHTSYLFTNLP